MPDTTHAQQLSVPAWDIRPGDVFTHHRRTLVAAEAPSTAPYGSVLVPLEGGGVAYLPRTSIVNVSRRRARKSTYGSWLSGLVSADTTLS